MLKYFVDDSGSDPKPSGLFVLYGYMMEELRWEDFSEKWDAKLKNPDFFPIPYCRMADAEAREGPFRDMEEPFRRKKVKELAEVIHECHPTAIGCKMTWQSYNRVVKGNVDSRLDNPYAILFFHVMRSVTDLQIEFNAKFSEEAKKEIEEKHGVAIKIKPVDFFFDDQGPAGLQCLRWWAALKSRVQEPHLTVIGNTPQFKDDREVVPLQAADMLAWHIRREFEYPNENRESVFSLINPAGVWESEVTDEQLHEIVDLFNTRVDPRSI